MTAGNAATWKEAGWDAFRRDPIPAGLVLIGPLIILAAGMSILQVLVYASGVLGMSLLLGFFAWWVVAPQVFNGGLIMSAHRHLAERVPPSNLPPLGRFVAGLRRMGVIAWWSFRLLSYRIGCLSRLTRKRRVNALDSARRGYGSDFLTATSLVPAVIVIEGRPKLETITRSAQLVRERWGAGAEMSIKRNMVPWILVAPSLVYLATIWLLGAFGIETPRQVDGIALSTIWLGGVPVASTIMGGYRRVALYHFAVHGRAPVSSRYSVSLLESAYQRRWRETPIPQVTASR